MPTYEYECDLCRHRFDKRQGFNDEPASTCPLCQGKAHRVFHAVPILFKGSGFYCTDHGRGWAPSPGKEEKEGVEKETTAAKGNETGTAKMPDKKDGKGDLPKDSKEQPQSSTAGKS